MPSKKDAPNRSIATRFVKGQSGNPKGEAPMVLDRALLPTIKQLASRGVREKDIARACDIDPSTWTKMKVADAKVAEAFAAGRQIMHDALVGKLYERAMAGDLVPALFLLKTTFGYREGDEPSDMRPQITIHLPGSADSVEAYRQGITIEATRIVPPVPGK